MINQSIIAVVAGGYSGEWKVSIASAKSLMQWIDRSKFSPYLIKLDHEGWSVVEGPQGESLNLPVDKNVFGCTLGNGETIRFEYAFITIHGTPGENGLLQGYFDMLQIPYNTGGVLTESLTFDKFACNHYLSSFPDIHVAKSIQVRTLHNIPKEDDVVMQLGLPVFVKPNAGGSSIATFKVSNREDLLPAIKKAFDEANEVLIESLLTGTEVTCGCYYSEGKGCVALPLTEVVSHNTFFDYEAKYKGAVDEITPARIPDDLRDRLQSLTKKIYGYVHAHGFIRADYIVNESGVPYLLEVNTTPGMTATSFIPQQVRAAGMTMTEVLTDIISQKLS